MRIPFRFQIPRPISLAFGLALIAISVLLAVDVLGLNDNNKNQVYENRKVAVETLALSLSNLVGQKDSNGMRFTLSLFVDRGEEVEAAALSDNTGRTLAHYGDESLLQMTNEDDRQNGLWRVPILDNGLPVLELHVLFKPSKQLFSHFQWLALIALGMFVGFALFLSSILTQLDPSKAVPERVDSAFNLFTAGVIVLDEKLRIIMANQVVADVVGKTVNELKGRSLSEWDWQKESGWQAPWETSLYSGLVVSDHLMRLKVPSGSVEIFSVNCASVGENSNQAKGVLVTFDNLTLMEQKNRELNDAMQALQESQEAIFQKNRELQILATTDPLTGINNRRTLMERLTQEFEKARSENLALSCFMSDVDHFKSVNDNYGHAVGDDVIKLVAHTLKAHCRESDFVGRYGGEEFVMVLPGTDAVQAAQVADRVRQKVMSLAKTEKLPMPKLTSSFGVSDLSYDPVDGGSLVDLADQALYVAKESGRNRVIVYEPEDSADQVEGNPSTQAVTASNESQSKEASHSSDSEIEKPAQNLYVGDDVDQMQERIHALEFQVQTLQDNDLASGIPFKQLFLERLEGELERANSDGTTVGVISLKLAIQRSIGSDSSLTEKTLIDALTNKLRGAVYRSNDLVTLLDSTLDDIEPGTDTVEQQYEFAILITDLAGFTSAMVVIARLNKLFEHPIMLGDSLISIDLSMGVSVSESERTQKGNLLENAIEARQKGNTSIDSSDHTLFTSPHLNQQSKEWLMLAKDFEHALEDGQLALWFQPQYSLAHRQISGMEGLLRWQHPQHGLISPGVFIEIAESQGTMPLLNRFVLKQTLAQMEEWDKLGFKGLQSAINLSLSQLIDPGFVDDLLTAVDSSPIENSRLEIEFVEDIALTRNQEIRNCLLKVEEGGVSLTLASFGNGQTPIALLSSLPLHRVKIDRSIISNMDTDTTDFAVAQSIINLARSLGISVVGEGVETNSALEKLARLGCDDVQGYLVSEPLPVNQVQDFLRQQSRKKVSNG